MATQKMPLSFSALFQHKTSISSQPPTLHNPLDSANNNAQYVASLQPSNNVPVRKAVNNIAVVMVMAMQPASQTRGAPYST